MARCGRCGLWNKYPEDHHEKKWDGVCIWYQVRLTKDEVWEERKCPDFFERIPGFHTLDHFDYKCNRDRLGDAFQEAHAARWIAWISLAVAVAGILSGWMSNMP
jgi:hypothetical protein